MSRLSAARQPTVRCTLREPGELRPAAFDHKVPHRRRSHSEGQQYALRFGRVGLGDPTTLDAVARQLEAGTVWIDQHINPNPDVPFTGHKTSGLGVQFGPEGLCDFCNPQIIAVRQ
jgi:hypothetical protein